MTQTANSCSSFLLADERRRKRNRKFVVGPTRRRPCKEFLKVKPPDPLITRELSGLVTSLNMSSLTSLESIYGSLTADITANTAKLERLGNQTDTVEDEEEDSTEKSENSLKSIILYSRNIAFYHFRKLAPNQLNVGSLR